MKTSNTPITWPQAVASYFAADKVDGALVSSCFAEEAIVKDEGHVYSGHDEIVRWKTEVSKKYEHTCQPVACEQIGERTLVACTVTGNFPGSPVDLRFFFEFRDEKITSLEIIF